MTYALRSVPTMMPTTQARTRRTPRCSNPTPSSASVAAVYSSFYTYFAPETTGNGRHRRLEVLCNSSQDQHIQVQQGGPDFSSLDLTLQQQWDVAANAHLGNLAIKSHSSRKVWWVCDQCPDGYLHSWPATIHSRSNGSGCPQCRGYKVCRHNSLATRAPGVAAQWDYARNKGTPDDVVASTKQTAHWLCNTCGHPWSAKIHARVMHNTGCPQCAKKAKKWTRRPTFACHPLLAEWDHQQNSVHGNHPDSITLQSNKQIFWLCRKCPAGQQHSWSARPYHRTGRNKCGCPVCAGKLACKCNSLEALYPGTAAEWDYSKNQGQPSDYPASSTHLAWWSSLQRGSWQQTINSRTCVVHQRTARLRHIQQRQTTDVSSQADR